MRTVARSPRLPQQPPLPARGWDVAGSPALGSAPVTALWERLCTSSPSPRPCGRPGLFFASVSLFPFACVDSAQTRTRAVSVFLCPVRFTRPRGLEVRPRPHTRWAFVSNSWVYTGSSSNRPARRRLRISLLWTWHRSLGTRVLVCFWIILVLGVQYSDSTFTYLTMRPLPESSNHRSLYKHWFYPPSPLFAHPPPLLNLHFLSLASF